MACWELLVEVSDCNDEGIGVNDDEQGWCECRCSEVSGCVDLVSHCEVFVV